MKFYLLPCRVRSRHPRFGAGARLGGRKFMSETKNDECQDQPFSNRASLITYLEYVVDEVAAVDEPAAVLLRMAISNLAHSDSQLPGSNYKHRLC
jgi:hypothetical protein